MMMSEHFKNDRADRYAFIATTIGVGTIIHSHKQAWNKWGTEPCTVNITSTGVAIVTNPENKIVTMYILTLKSAQQYFDSAIPMVLDAIIKANMRKRLHILQNEIKY